MKGVPIVVVAVCDGFRVGSWSLSGNAAVGDSKLLQIYSPSETVN
jgi:hypothetical protein